MAKEKMAELNKVYESILGKGEPISGEEDSSTASGTGDEAYKNEDYSDDSGDGVDPRDESSGKADGDESVPDDDSSADDSSTEEKHEDDGQESKSDDEDSEVIPERLVSAGRRARLDDDTIIELAETRPEILEALAKSQETAAAALAAENAHQEPGKKKAGGEKQESSDDDPLKEIEKLLNPDEEGYEDLTPTAKQIIKALMKKVESLDSAVKGQSKGLESIQAREQREAIRRIDTFFDSHAELVPVLGNASKGLSPEQVEARKFAHRVAMGAQGQWGGTMSDEDALVIGINALKGSMNETQLKAKLVSDLNRNKKRFTARYKGRSQHGGGEGSKSADERAREAIDRVLDDPKYSR